MLFIRLHSLFISSSFDFVISLLFANILFISSSIIIDDDDDGDGSCGDDGGKISSLFGCWFVVSINFSSFKFFNT